MTTIKSPVRRKSDAVVRDQGKLRRLVITIYPNDTIGVRPEKTRREEIVSIEAVYSLGVKQRLASERATKIREKKARKM